MMFPQNERPLSFKIGEQVRILAGPFASFAGVTEEIDDANSRMKVAVSIFGSPTPVEIELSGCKSYKADEAALVGGLIVAAAWAVTAATQEVEERSSQVRAGHRTFRLFSSHTKAVVR
jgi:hypothetical protein